MPLPHSSLIKWQTSLHNFPHHNLSNTSYQQTYTCSNPFLHSLRQNSLNSSFPFHLISFKLFLLQLFLHSLTSLPPSLHTGIFPSAFKQARITPLLKKPTLNPTLLWSYRPVSLLPFIAKILEHIMFNQVSAFLTQNNLLNSKPSGFRSGHSNETALLSVVETLRLARAASKSSLLILLDRSAAFDKVNHQILQSTLLRKGISGTTLQCFESYLSDRSF